MGRECLSRAPSGRTIVEPKHGMNAVSCALPLDQAGQGRWLSQVVQSAAAVSVTLDPSVWGAGAPAITKPAYISSAAMSSPR